jgi:hypothetical protein
VSVLLLADAKTHLNITGDTHNTELQAMIDAAEAAIETYVGPLTAREVTQRVSGSGTYLVLHTLPVISLTSVTPYGGSALTVGDLYLDAETGLVTYPTGVRFGSGVHTVVYQAGRTSVPKDLELAIKELVRHLWSTQRGSGQRRPGTAPPEQLAATLPGAAYTLPIRVTQLLAPHTIVPVA